MRIAIVVLALTNLFIQLDHFFMVAVATKVQRDFGISNFQIGLLVASVALGNVFGGLYLGNLGDRRDRRQLMAYGSFTSAAAAVFTAIAPSLEWLLLARVLSGAAEAAILTNAPAYLKSGCRDDRETNTVLSLFYLSFPAGAAIGFVSGGLIGVAGYWQEAFYLWSVPGILLGLACWRLKAAPPAAAHARVESFASSVRRILRVRSFRALLVCGALWGFYVSGIGAWGSKYCVDKFHYDLRTVTSVIGSGIAMSAGIGMTLGGRLGAVFVKDDMRAGGFCRFATACAGLAIPFPLLAVLAPTFWPCVLCFFASLILMYAMLSPGTTAALILAPADRLATAQSLLDITAQLCGFMLGPPIVGYIADAIGLDNALAVTSVPILFLLFLVYAGATRGLTPGNPAS